MCALLLLLVACGGRVEVEVPPEVASSPPEVEAVRPPELPFLERLTAGASAEETLPLVIAVHGRGDAPERFVRLLEELPFPARLVVPEAPDRWGHGFSWFPVAAGQGDRPELGAALVTQAARVAELAEWAAGARSTRGEPVVVGFSQGGMLAFAVAVRHPDAVAAAMPVGGWLPPSAVESWEAPPDAPRIRVFHGEQDDVIPIGPTREGVKRLADGGWDVELGAYAGIRHGISDRMRQDLHRALREVLEAEVAEPSAAPGAAEP